MWWRALGVEPTDDKATVKKAYASLIKTIDQDNDIDTFTNVHRAYRMAMQSFKDEKGPAPKGLIDYEGQTHWYLEELAKIYNNPNRRLSTEAWKNLFACMSFIEEKHFLSEYITFFNEHYALTEEIWALVDIYYPLSNRKEFRWPELVKGHMTVPSEEIDGLTFDQASNYVTYKIHVYYALLDKDYDRALIFLRILLKDYNRSDINHWYMLITTELDLAEEVQLAYGRMLETPNSLARAGYLYAGYLTLKGDWQKSMNILEEIPEAQRTTNIQSLIMENQYHLTGQTNAEISSRPWISLAGTSAKKQKLLSKGNYQKALQSDTVGLRTKLWGSR